MEQDTTGERAAILSALLEWINQRPGLDPRNYISHGLDDMGRSAYRSESRSITRQMHDAREMLAAVRWRESITADDLKSALGSAYSGRLTWDGSRLDYCTGQYWPTEYRAAVCAVLAYALWYYWRDCCPEGADDKADRIRASARRELGRGIASRWFD